MPTLALRSPAAKPTIGGADARSPVSAQVGLAFLISFSAVAVGLGAARAATTSYVPVLLDEIADRPGLIGLAMLTNALAGFFVPLAVGLWADRHPSRRPLIVGGVAISAGGLVAVALGSATTYLVLTLAAAAVYVGLNVVQTAHRALVPERFDEGARPRATSAQELGQLVGALVGTVVGGVLVLAAPGLLFAAVAGVAVLTALPTLRLATVRQHTSAPAGARPATIGSLGAALRRRGTRELLVAQALWVAAYVGLTPFFVLYAKHVLGLSTGAAGGLLAGFGLLTGAGMLLAARVRPEQVRQTLTLGVASLGAGLSLAATGSTLAAVAAPFALAAVGAGVATSLGFVYFSRFIPAGETGRYSGAFLAARALAAGIALPAAGLIVDLTGSYRALLAMGTLALVAVIPIWLAERRVALSRRRAPVRSLAAVIPVFQSDRFAEVAVATARYADRVILVDDGAPRLIAEHLDRVIDQHGFELVSMGINRGKGAALVAGIDAALDRGATPDAILLIDSDDQHPPERIPAFLAAAEHADVVIGDRSHDRARMPALRRLANAASSLGMSVRMRQRVPDGQNGMRLLRVDALQRVPVTEGRYEAESRHLIKLARAKMKFAWVEMPAVYNGEPSSFRPVVDTFRVAREIVGPRKVAEPLPAAGALVAYTRAFGPRLLALVMLAISVGAALPALQALDERLFLAINGLGDGPEWLYQALDPHSRNYALIVALAVVVSLLVRRPLRYVGGVALTVVFAAFFADMVLELTQLSVDRPRPEEAVGAGAALSHGRSWGHIPSFPSGHLVVTAAMVAAAATTLPKLRAPLLLYLGAVAVTRILFGAHFPLDVAIGAILGWEVGLFAAGLAAAAGLLPRPQTERPTLPQLGPVRQPVVGGR
ncbi:MAG: MFS transporter [Actinomycetota bacterium]|nr:MFS transporter [Actinomycetota bacterium]